MANSPLTRLLEELRQEGDEAVRSTRKIQRRVDVGGPYANLGEIDVTDDGLEHVRLGDLEPEPEPDVGPFGQGMEGHEPDYKYGQAPGADISYNNLLELQMNGVDINWAAYGDLNIPEVDPIDPQMLEEARNESFNMLMGIGRQGVQAYMKVAAGLINTMENAGAGLHGGMVPFGKAGEDFLEMEAERQQTDAPLAKPIRSMAHDIAVTPEEYERLSMGERITLGTGALAMELPLIIASMTYTAPVRGGTEVQRLGRFLKAAVPNQKSQMGWLAGLADAAAEGVAFGNLTLIEETTPEAQLDQVAWQYAWSVATGFAFGLGGKLAQAFNLPVVARELPGGTIAGSLGSMQTYAEGYRQYLSERAAVTKELKAAGYSDDQIAQALEDIKYSPDHGAAGEAFVEQFAVIFALGLAHEPRRIRFEKKVKDYARIIKEREKVKQGRGEELEQEVLDEMAAEAAEAEKAEKAAEGGKKTTLDKAIERADAEPTRPEDYVADMERILKEAGVPDDKIQGIIANAIGEVRAERGIETEKEGKKAPEKKAERKTEPEVEPEPEEEITEPTEDMPPEPPPEQPEEAEPPAPAKEMTEAELKAERKAIQDATPDGKGRSKEQSARLREIRKELKKYEKPEVTARKEEKKAERAKEEASDEDKKKLADISRRIAQLEALRKDEGKLGAEDLKNRKTYQEGRKPTLSLEEIAEQKKLEKEGGKTSKTRAKRRLSKVERELAELLKQAEELTEGKDFGDFDPSRPEKLEDIIEPSAGEKYRRSVALYKHLTEASQREFVREHTRNKRVSITMEELAEWEMRASPGEEVDLTLEGAPPVTEPEGPDLSMIRLPIKDYVKELGRKLKRKESTVQKIQRAVRDAIPTKKKVDPITSWLDKNVPTWKNQGVENRMSAIRKAGGWPVKLSETKSEGAVPVSKRTEVTGKGKNKKEKTIYTYASEIITYEDIIGRRQQVKEVEVETVKGKRRVPLGEAIVRMGAVPVGLNTKGKGMYIGNGMYATEVLTPPLKGFFDWIPEEMVSYAEVGDTLAVNTAAWHLGVEPFPLSGKERIQRMEFIKDVLAASGVEITLPRPDKQDVADMLNRLDTPYTEGDDTIVQVAQFLSEQIGRPIYVKALDATVDLDGSIYAANWVLGKQGMAGYEYEMQNAGDFIRYTFKEENIRETVYRETGLSSEEISPEAAWFVITAPQNKELIESKNWDALAGEMRDMEEFVTKIKNMSDKDVGLAAEYISLLPPGYRENLMDMANMNGNRELTMIELIGTKAKTHTGHIRHVGIGVTRKWFRDRKLDLTGIPFRGVQDIGDLGVLFRGPVETMHIIPVSKGQFGKIEAGSIRSPAYAKPWYGVEPKYFVEKKRDGYYIMEKVEGGKAEAKDSPWDVQRQKFIDREVGKTVHRTRQSAEAEARMANDRAGIDLKWLERLAERAEKEGWDEVYFQHNHPGGAALTSGEDIIAMSKWIHLMESSGNQKLKKLAKKMKGMVVTNHDHYSFVSPEQIKDFKLSDLRSQRGMDTRMAWMRDVSPEAMLPSNPWNTPEMAHEGLYKMIPEGDMGIEAVRDIARTMYTGQAEQANIIVEDNRGAVVNMYQVPNSWLRSGKALKQVMTEQMREVGGTRSHIYTSDAELLKKSSKELEPLVNEGIVGVAIGETGEYIIQPDGAKTFIPHNTVNLVQEVLGVRSTQEGADAWHWEGVTEGGTKTSAEKTKEKKPFYVRRENMDVEPVMPEWVSKNDMKFREGGKVKDRATIIQDLEEVTFQPGIFRRRQVVKTPTRLQSRTGRTSWRVKVGGRTIEIRNLVDFENVLKAHGAKFADLIPGLDVRNRPEILKLAPDKLPTGMSKGRAGMAEWFHMWIVDPELAQKAAPNLTRLVEEVVSDKSLGHVRNYIEKMRQSWVLLNQPDAVKFLATFMTTRRERELRAEQGWRRWVPATWDELYTYYKDDMWPIIKATREAKKHMQGGLNPSQDPGVLGQALRGTMGRADVFLTGTGPFVFDGKSRSGMKNLGPSLRDILNDVIVAGEKDVLNVYLFGQRLATDPKLAEGYTKELGLDFAEYTRRVNEKLDKEFPHFKKVAEQIGKYNHSLLDYMVQSEWITPRDAENMKKKNAFYVPFHAVVEEYRDFPVFNVGAKNKRANLFNPLKRKTGRAVTIYEPIESMIYNTMAVLNTADSNKIGAAMWRMKDNPVFADLISWHNYRSRPVTISPNEMAEILKSKGVGEDLIKELGEDNLLIWRPNRKLKANELVVRVEGKEKIMQVHDPLLFRALRGEPAADIHTGIVAKSAAKLAEIQRTTATSLSHKFLARNPFKDQIMAHIYSKFGYTPFFGLYRGAKERIEAGEIWQQFNASGAAMAAMNSIEGKHAMNRFEEITKGKGEGQRILRNLYKNPYQFLREASEIVENSTRVEAFRNAMKTFERWIGERDIANDMTNELVGGTKKFKEFAEKHGYDMEKFDFVDALLLSGLEAKDITVDFSRKGSRGALINRYAAFHNAHLEGTSKFIRAWKDQPGKTAFRTAYSITIPALALWYWQKDDPIYRSLPNWRKIMMFNSVVRNPINGDYFFTMSIPKPFEPGIAFGTLPELWFDYLYTYPVDDPIKKRAAAAALKEGLAAAGYGLKPNIMPSAITPVVEWWANKNFFYGRPIVPMDRTSDAAYQQYQPWTNEAIKGLAKVVAETPGIAWLAKERWGPMNPAKIENTIRAWTTGAGGLVLGITDRLYRAIPWDGMEERQLKPAPHIRDWFMIDAITARWPSPRSRALEIFYDEFDKIESKWREHTRNAGIRGTGATVDPMDFIIINGTDWTQTDGMMLKHFRAYHNEISMWYLAADRIWSAPQYQYGRVDKRDMLDALYWQLNQMAEQALGGAATTATAWGVPELDDPNNVARIWEEYRNAKKKANIRLNQKYLRGD